MKRSPRKPVPPHPPLRGGGVGRVKNAEQRHATHNKRQAPGGPLVLGVLEIRHRLRSYACGGAILVPGGVVNNG